ncbi:unnamed protein product [Aspergillus oryzae RIB40]|uniref:DNA, SC005 n=2 Tax=Aspergillus oryzae TaxID=5062 RepID=Q2UTC3_ASPOR|nr:unnamed protein product [Aspergillus oryzae RIB40]EIT79682.1 hypothetical protein Ao3042_03909 [Aspergillus oryzae 3.042]KDE78437.1 hypothetical protein AO1008_04635 [Aspergillus oryzae 100-8]BAE55192.1 unnamed protein product [Aspergillus oryzae RIB40]|eukprot:EIT79682.1 hypothetical protein Ao3042_03909 [Aspergillus oryzae 3.042]
MSSHRDYYLEHFTNPRADLVDELIARVHDYHIIRVIGPPASGKTTLMKLMVNKLLEMNGPTKSIHVLTGWDKQEVCGAPGWARYLGQKTGVHGEEWLSNPAYLLLDEAQQTYWDSGLWASFFKSAGPGWSVFIVLFMSYGSPGEGLEGFESELYSSVPMHFGPDQEIFLRLEKSISDLYLAQKPVGLLLD